MQLPQGCGPMGWGAPRGACCVESPALGHGGGGWPLLAAKANTHSPKQSLGVGGQGQQGKQAWPPWLSHFATLPYNSTLLLIDCIALPGPFFATTFEIIFFFEGNQHTLFEQGQAFARVCTRLSSPAGCQDAEGPMPRCGEHS